MDKPSQVFIWFKPICNLRCKQCGIWKENKKNMGGGFSYQNAEKIIYKLNDWLGSDFTLNFLGGELFLYKKFLSLVQLSDKLGIRTSVTTNGSLIDKSMARKIVFSGLSYIAVSLDSVDPKIHNKQRGLSNLHQQVMEAIKHLVSTKIETYRPLKIFINSLIFKQNLKEIIPLVLFASNLGVDAITFQPIADPGFFGPGEIDNKWYEKSDFWPEYAETKKVITKLIELKNQGEIIGNTLTDLKKFLDYFKNPIKFATSYSCHAHLDSLVISAEGEIKLCPSMSAIGKILKDDLDRVWSNNQAQKARGEIIKCKKQCKILSLYKEDFYF